MSSEDTIQGTHNLYVGDPLPPVTIGPSYLDWISKMSAKAPPKPYDHGHDYLQDISEDDMQVDGDNKFVYLRGLEKLARARGIKRASSNVTPILDGKGNITAAVCTFQYEFLDGSMYDGSADATNENTKGAFGTFKVALAESRAKARALRNAFGISLCSVEEKGVSPESFVPAESGKIADYQIGLIVTLLERAGLSVKDALAKATKRPKVFKLEDLTKEEGTSLIQMLNQCIADMGKVRRGQQ